jgi:hypothetical protein
MGSLAISRGWRLGLAAVAFGMLAAAPDVRASTLGGATVSVNRLAGQPGIQELPIPAGAIDFETPVASLSANLGFPNEPPFLRAQARAVAGIDLSRGAFYGTISTFARNESPGEASRASAHATVVRQETFQVLSDTLPAGTLVDVNFDLRIRFRGSAGATGLGTCCSILSTYEFSIEGNLVPYDSSYAYLPRTGSAGILAGGINGDAIELSFGRYSAPAIVGGSFFLGVYFEVESVASATAVYDPQSKRYVPGQSEASGSASLFLATEVTPAAGAAARAQAGSAYLYSQAGGFALPGAEAFDAANLDAHWLAPVPLPEPGTAALLALGLAVLSARARRGP